MAFKGRRRRSAALPAGSETPPTQDARAGPDETDPAPLLLRAFLENTGDSVYFKDRDSRFLRISNSMLPAIRLERPEDAIGHSDFDYFPPEFAEETYADEQEIVRTGEPLVDKEEAGLAADGSFSGWVETTKLPLRDERGEIVGTFGITRDVTARRLAETALLEHTERLERVIETQRDVASADLDLRAVMELICERTQELTGADSTTILSLEGGRFVYRAATGFMSERLGTHVPLENTFTGWVHKRGRATLANDVQALPYSTKLAAAWGVASVVAVPLRHGTTVAQLQILSRRRDAFVEHDLNTLELLSVVLSSALSHASELEAKHLEVEALVRLRTIFEGASIGIVRTDAAGRTVEVNPALEELLGYSAAELRALDWRVYTHPGDAEHEAALFAEMMAGTRSAYRLEKRCYRKGGELVWVHVTATLERDAATGEPAFAISMIENISERKVAEEGLRAQARLNEHQALHDALTGLPNRVLFRDRIEQAILGARRTGDGVAVVMIDLDRFKEINDSLGHHTGDVLLKELGARLRAGLRESDTVARLGGDEFGFVLPRVSGPGAVIRILDQIRKAMEQPVVLQDLSLAIEASVGVSLFPEHGIDVDTLLQHADVAMYVAKGANTGYAFYDEASHERNPERLKLVGELRRAIDERELVLHYQPKVALADGSVNSVEGLVRWEHPERGLLAPDEFVPLIQPTGLIKPLTLYVVERALEQCRAWQEEGLTLSIAINLSMRNLLDADFPAHVQGLLDLVGVDSSMLEFEITESTMLTDPVRTKAILTKLSSMGIRLSIDDFGTGYSSLAYLTSLPIDEIKIDRSFVMQISDSPEDDAIVRSTIDLGRNLGLEVVAEGVENEAVCERLRALGCSYAQGFYLSPPVPPDELRTWLRERVTSESAIR